MTIEAGPSPRIPERPRFIGEHSGGQRSSFWPVLPALPARALPGLLERLEPTPAHGTHGTHGPCSYAEVTVDCPPEPPRAPPPAGGDEPPGKGPRVHGSAQSCISQHGNPSPATAKPPLASRARWTTAGHTEFLPTQYLGQRAMARKWRWHGVFTGLANGKQKGSTTSS